MKNTAFSLHRTRYKTSLSIPHHIIVLINHVFLWNSNHDKSSLQLCITIALKGNLHFLQSKNLRTFGHFLVQSLCPASKIRTKGQEIIKTKALRITIREKDVLIQDIPIQYSLVGYFGSLGHFYLEFIWKNLSIPRPPKKNQIMSKYVLFSE